MPQNFSTGKPGKQTQAKPWPGEFPGNPQTGGKFASNFGQSFKRKRAQT